MFHSKVCMYLQVTPKVENPDLSVSLVTEVPATSSVISRVSGFKLVPRTPGPEALACLCHRDIYNPIIRLIPILQDISSCLILGFILVSNPFRNDSGRGFTRVIRALIFRHLHNCVVPCIICSSLYLITLFSIWFYMASKY